VIYGPFEVTPCPAERIYENNGFVRCLEQFLLRCLPSFIPRLSLTCINHSAQELIQRNGMHLTRIFNHAPGCVGLAALGQVILVTAAIGFVVVSTTALFPTEGKAPIVGLV
jgi:hypothetical protein